MNSKWYVGALIIVFAFLGISLDQIAVPNQEIVVKFANDKVSLTETQNTIAIVKKQLQIIGVDNIKVVEGEDGKLKITYYSDVDVASIKRIFSKEKNFEFDYASFNHQDHHSKFPLDQSSSNFKLDVYEIQESDDGERDYNGYVLEQNQEFDRFNGPSAPFSAKQISGSEKSKIDKVAYLAHRNIAIAIDNSSHNIPEVRAGPRV